jgi:hypothetical protein
VSYGKQYDYQCPSCRREVVPPMTPSLVALDLTDLGTRIGDKPIKTFPDGHVGPFAASTMARAQRCLERFGDFPAVLMPAKGVHGSERHPWQPMSTQTSQQETALLLAVDNYQGAPRGADEPLATQVGSETFGVVSAGVVPYRNNTVPTMLQEAMPTFTAEQIPGVLSATGTVSSGGLEAVQWPYQPGLAGLARAQEMLFSGWYKQNGTSPNHGTAPHPLTDSLGTITAHDTTALLNARWHASLADLRLENCYYRMMKDYEIGVGCGFDVDFGSRKGTFIVWGSARDQVDGFGNAVSPQVGEWIGLRLRAVIHSPQDRLATAA